MKKNDLFTFTAPNGVEVRAIVVYEGLRKSGFCCYEQELLCYAQNRLFTYVVNTDVSYDENCRRKETDEYSYGKVIVDYCILPDYDAMLAMDYPLWERNMESPDPDEIPDELIAQAETSIGM